MNTRRVALLDGVPERGLALDNRGTAYGDGLFETIDVHAGEPRWLEDHLARLRAGCARLALHLDEAGLRDDIRRAITTVPCARGALKLIVLRDSLQRRGYQPMTDRCQRIVLYEAIAPADTQRWQHGVKLRLCRQRLSCNPALAGLKHLNRLEQVMARAEWTAPEFAEGLMQDESGALIEGTMSNLFLVRGGRLLTPALTECGVNGIVRARVLAYWRDGQGSDVAVRRLTLDDLYHAQEIFITNTLIGLWPVVAVDCHAKPAGPVTRRLQKAFAGFWGL